ncbi:progranulin isoform X2 [Paroedura picta]
MWNSLVLGLILCGAVSSLRCPDGLECGGLHGCCKRPGGEGYACCDQPQFPGVSLRMLPPSTGNEASGVVCPDGSTCPLEYSCLRTPDASYGCCPWGEAVSCADGHHCCPRGFHCSADGHSCFRSTGFLPPSPVDAVQCPDGESQCPDGSTCCLMADGSWGCCPIPEASCCADKIHCCPHATTCDVTHSRCLSASGEEPLRTKFPARKRASALALPQKNICANSTVTCPDIATCCPLPTGQYGCCPLQNAVCCSDRAHCCPQGTTCDLTHSKCTLSPRRSWPMTRLLVGPEKARVVRCDSEYACPDGNTCCRQPSGEWGCCPLVEAVCCSDGVHCCPAGYTCNVAEGTCDKGTGRPLQLAKPSAGIARAGAAPSGSVVPCDPQTACPDGNTCCRLPTGDWGCCPLPQAVCCLDHLHCCPSGYQCGSSPGTCEKDGESIPWLEKRPAMAHGTSLSRDVRCDDQASCPDGHTCCRMTSGAWGCCPLPQAVCCSDHLHCCPSGYTCGPTAGSCEKDGESIPWLEKRPAVVHVTGSSLSTRILGALALARRVKCDEQTTCPDGQTCCQKASGDWGCCLFPQAICCPDHVHCCPSGYTCDVAASMCTMAWRGLPWGPGGAAELLQSRDVQCDDTTSCEEGQTCCKNKAGAWSCCQLPNAVCCADHQHCCPLGYTCNLQAQTCDKQRPQSAAPEGEQPSLLLSPARPAATNGDVPCDAQHYCHERQTCCPSSTGGWACCPFDKGSCCSDKRHCCPSGYRCSSSGLSCVRKAALLRWDAGGLDWRATESRPLL